MPVHTTPVTLDDIRPPSAPADAIGYLETLEPTFGFFIINTEYGERHAFLPRSVRIALQDKIEVGEYYHIGVVMNPDKRKAGRCPYLVVEVDDLRKVEDSEFHQIDLI